MLLVLDSNEYIFALGILKKETSITLLDKILATFPVNTIRIPRMITEEVKHNITPEAFKEFIGFITSFTSIDEDLFVPFEIGAKFEKVLKPADAFIAAYTEWTGADALVTENRHFLSSRQTNLPFKVLTAENCLKLLK